ncbi:hypothetical protein EA58_14485 [Photobacterium galatheae]|uniref:TEGT family carrier/transport protein n=2 Tax=Photobacterium galatheae TaxID=1654360 RepID=A0A066RKT2_9GAMM|nr:hypothetical protein EA58_14485 [Photobacterium galatheae]
MIVASISPIILFLGTFLVAVLGSVMAGVRGNIPVQLIGFSLVPIALGFISAPWFASVEHEILYEAGVLTLLALGVMMIASAMFPAFFQRIMGFLMIALIGLILVSLVAVFFLKIEMTLIHILSVVIFMGFLGFDLVMARTVEPTLTNAIALSTSIFIDLLNIFMNLAQLLGDD